MRHFQRIGLHSRLRLGLRLRIHFGLHAAPGAPALALVALHDFPEQLMHLDRTGLPNLLDEVHSVLLVHGDVGRRHLLDVMHMLVDDGEVGADVERSLGTVHLDCGVRLEAKLL